MRLVITFFNLGSGACAMLSSTFWVIFSSVLLLMVCSFPDHNASLWIQSTHDASGDKRVMAIPCRPPAESQHCCCQQNHDGLDSKRIGNHTSKKQDGDRAGIIQHRLEGKHTRTLLPGRVLQHHRLRRNIHHIQRYPHDKRDRSHQEEDPFGRESELHPDEATHGYKYQTSSTAQTPQ